MALIQKVSIPLEPSLLTQSAAITGKTPDNNSVVEKAFRDLTKSNNEVYNAATELLAGGGTHFRSGLHTIPQASNSTYSFDPGFNLPFTSSSFVTGEGTFYRWEYIFLFGLLEDPAPYNFSPGLNGLTQFVAIGDPVPEFQFEIEVQLRGVATPAAFDICWAVIY